MPAFNFQDLFGSNVEFIDGGDGFYRLSIQLNDFQDESSGGSMTNGQGTNNPAHLSATQVFYGLILLILSNQAAQVNDDPEQKIHITQSAKSIATGARDGQVRRSFMVNFFSEAGLAGTSGIDAIEVNL